MTTNAPHVKAIAYLANELSRASMALMSAQIAQEMNLAFRDGREESPMADIDALWDAVREHGLLFQRLDKSAFQKAKEKALNTVLEPAKGKKK